MYAALALFAYHVFNIFTNVMLLYIVRQGLRMEISSKL